MITISSGSCSTAENIWCKTMNLLTVLVSNNGTSSRTSVCCKSNSFLQNMWLISYILDLFDQFNVTYSKHYSTDSGTSFCKL